MNTDLFNAARQLNYDEAVRRLFYWAREKPSARQQSALRMLAQALDRNRDNLYFEERKVQ